MQQKLVLLIGLSTPVISYATNTITLDPIIVKGQEPTYLNQTSEITVGSRIPTKPINSSRSINVIDNTLITDRNATTMTEAIQNVSGVNVEPSSVDGNRSNYMLRGFTIDDDWGTKVDGQMNLEWADFDLFNVDRIEVSKGPNAAVNGLSDPGGFINIITKKATWTKEFELSQTGGLYGYHKTNAAYTTPITDWLASRTTVSYTDGNNPSLFGTSTNKERLALSQNFMVKITDKTKLQFDIRHLSDHQNYGMSSFLPAIGNGPAPINPRTNLSTSHDYMNVDDTQVGYQLTSEITNKIEVHHDFKYQVIDRAKRFLNPIGINESTGDMTATYYWLNTNKTYTSTDNYLTFKQDLIGHKNNLVVGANFVNTDIITTNQSTSAQQGDTCANTNALYCYNIYNPNFSNFNWVTGSATTSYGSQGSSGSRDDNGGAGHFNQNHWGLYTQDQLFIREDLIFSSGIRYNISSQSGHNVTSATDTALSPNLGLTYKITPSWSIYTDWAKSFMPQSQSSLKYTPPQLSTQHEIGIKHIDPSSKYSITAAWFDLTKKNVQTIDPTNPVWYTYVGEVNTNGYEVDGSYKLGNFKIIGNWAYTNSSITNDTTASNIGNRFPSVAKQQFGSWLHWDSKILGYEVGSGIGFNHIGSRYGDTANTFMLPAYTIFDTSTYFKPTKNLKISLNIKNLTDQRYYVGAASRFSIMQGQPLTGFINLDYTL